MSQRIPPDVLICATAYTFFSPFASSLFRTEQKICKFRLDGSIAWISSIPRFLLTMAAILQTARLQSGNGGEGAREATLASEELYITYLYPVGAT